MKISQHIYKTSGVEYETNSNTYVLETENELILFDLGYEDKQWNVVKKTLQYWELDRKPIREAFLTHGHYDHAGNTHKANEEGLKVYGADPDAYKIENGYPEMERLFNREWVCGRVDERLEDNEIFEYKDARVTAYQMPGHSLGSYAFVIEADGHRALVTGDAFFTRPVPPEDKIDLDLAFMGGEDFSREDFLNSLKKMSELHCDILLPGHYYVYYGDVDALCRKAYEQLKEMDA